MTAQLNYRSMTAEQMLAWGQTESKARIADLAGVRTAEALKAAQDAAEGRRKMIGATRDQAADMVILANREARRDA